MNWHSIRGCERESLLTQEHDATAHKVPLKMGGPQNGGCSFMTFKISLSESWLCIMDLQPSPSKESLLGGWVFHSVLAVPVLVS